MPRLKDADVGTTSGGANPASLEQVGIRFAGDSGDGMQPTGLTSSHDRLAGVVLVGGSSRRMGRDKATMPCPGAPGLTMVEHLVGVVGSRCAPVFVVAAPGQSLPSVAAEVIIDDFPGSGPLAAAAGGLRAAARTGADRAFVCAVDMPYLTAELIDQLAQICCDGTGIDIALPWDGKDHYLAGIYRCTLAGRIEALVAAGRRSMRSLADVAVTSRLVLDSGARVLTNLNFLGEVPESTDPS